MVETSKTNFVKQYEPGNQARVELKNGRILDVVNGRYFDAGTSVILRRPTSRLTIASTCGA
jgi:hypothetical protein